jgi:hypothetical protein
MLLDRIRPLYFFAAFAIGLLACYVMAPRPEVVVKFPTPYNAGTVVYRDKADSCYAYDATKSECPRDPSAIRTQPITENFD